MLHLDVKAYWYTCAVMGVVLKLCILVTKLLNLAGVHLMTHIMIQNQPGASILSVARYGNLGLVLSI